MKKFKQFFPIVVLLFLAMVVILTPIAHADGVPPPPPPPPPGPGGSSGGGGNGSPTLCPVCQNNVELSKKITILKFPFCRMDISCDRCGYDSEKHGTDPEKLAELGEAYGEWLRYRMNTDVLHIPWPEPKQKFPLT